MYIICKKRQNAFNVTKDEFTNIQPNYLYKIINNNNDKSKLKVLELQDLEYPNDIIKILLPTTDSNSIQFNTLIDYIIYLLDSLSISA